MSLGSWTQGKFITHDEDEEVKYPDHYFKIEKLLDEVWVNTGWAEDEKAVERHAIAIGGSVRATNNVRAMVFEEQRLVDMDSKIVYNDYLEFN